MEDSDMICEFSLMYIVVRGMCSILEDDYGRLHDGGSLEKGAVDCGTWWLREQMERLWPELSRERKK